MRLRALLFVLLACGACKGSSSSQGPTSTQFASFMADAFCGALKGCCAAANTAYDDAACRGEMTDAFNVPVLAAEKGNVAYDSTAVVACANAMRDREAMCVGDAGPPPAANGHFDPVVLACAGVWKGALAPGATCTTSFECRTTGPEQYAECVSDPTGGKKTCLVTSEHGLPGSVCNLVHVDNVLASCEPALGYCEFANDAGTDGTCAAYVGLGGSCVARASHSPLCDPARSYCDAKVSLTCVPLPNAGEACPGLRCADGLACDPTLSPPACASPLANGSSCTQGVQCASQVCNGVTSTGDGGLKPGQCTPPGTGNPNLESAFDVPRACSGVLPTGQTAVPPFVPR